MRSACLLLLVAVACSKAESKSADGSASGAPSSGNGSGAAAAAASSAAIDAVLDSWKKSGLTVTAFDVADGSKYGGGACRAGQLNGVDATVCELASPEAAKAAEPKGLDAIGATTGASIAHGALLLVIADRRKADPEGRTINIATRLFEGKPAVPPKPDPAATK